MLIASIGAFCIGEYPEAVAVMLLYTVGRCCSMELWNVLLRILENCWMSVRNVPGIPEWSFYRSGTQGGAGR